MSLRLRSVLLMIGAALVAVSADSRAQEQIQVIRPATATTATEDEALEHLSNGLLVSARTSAEQALSEDEYSIVGHYVLGRVYFEAEGSLARAMRHLGRARELYESSGAPNDQFHQELLYATARLAGQLELYEYQMELLGYYDHLYDPDLIAERCWPLMKLGRMDEARQFAEIAVGSPNPWQRSAGLNALCAVEGEDRQRGAYRDACVDALESARQEIREQSEDEEGGGIAVDAFNAGSGALAALDFEEAESFVQEGAARFEPTPANPWRFLAQLYVSEGRMDDAINAFGQMMHWNDRVPASLRDETRAETEGVVAMVLLMAGETDQAMMRIDRALARPDRRALTTAGAEQTRGHHALLRLVIRRALDEEAAERASWEGRGAQVGNAIASIGDGLAGWPDRERVVAVMTDERLLSDTLRPYVPGGADKISPWLTGELIDVLGPAVVAVGLRQAERPDADEPATEGFYTALRAELAAANGDDERAIQLANQALPLLEASGWTLVRARMAAVVAEAAWDGDQRATANELYTIAMEADPNVFRRLGMAIPCSFRGNGGQSSTAADLLSRSPRFFSSDDGFQIEVTQDGELLRACLRTVNGNELRCADVGPPPPEPEAEEGEEGEEATAPSRLEQQLEGLDHPQRLAWTMHRALFSARIELSTVDLNSLDGHTNGGSVLANERLRDLMAE